MNTLTQEVLLGVASNGLWSLIAKGSTATIQSAKDALSKKTTLDQSIQSALAKVAEKYPLGSGPEKARLISFIESPEIESAIRQLYASAIVGPEPQTLESIRKEFTALFALHLDVDEDAVESPADALFDAIALACNEYLAAATQCGLLEAHESLSAVRHRRLYDELASIDRNLILLTSATKPNISSFLEFEQKYRGQVGVRHGTIQPPHFDSARKVPIDDLYVAPRFSTVPRSKQAEPQTVTLRPLLTHVHRAVVIGNPGGGKSTLAAKIVHDLATQHDERLACNRVLTPVIVVLREYGRLKKDENVSIVQFIELQANSNYQVPAPSGALDYLLLNGRLLVIFDGLDELLDTAYRQEISADVEAFCNLYSGVPVLVTSREVGYEQAPLDEQRFSLFRIMPFDEDQIRDYARKWFSRDEAYNAHQREQKAKAFLDESQLAHDLRSNPLMLGLMCNLYRVEGYIPRNRADVYEKCSVMLFERWDKGRGILVQLPFEENIRPAMQHLAFWIYSDESLQTGVTRDNLIERTSAYLEKWVFDNQEKARAAASRFIEFCTGRAWVFTDTGTTADGEKLFQFTHRTFLEYFTASYLASVNPTPNKLSEVLRSRIRKEEWDVVALLAYQVQSRRVEGAADELLLDLVSSSKLPSSVEATAALSFAARCLEAMVPSPATRRVISLTALDYCVLERSDLFPPAGALSTAQQMPANRLLAPLLVANVENRSTIAEVFYDRLVAVARQGTPKEKLNALEVAFHPFSAFGHLHRPPGPEVMEYWRGVMARVLTAVPSVIRDLASEDLSLCIDAVTFQFVRTEDFLLWHGTEGLFKETFLRLFRLGRLSYAYVLLHHLAAYQAGSKSIQGVETLLTRIEELGTFLKQSATPWTKADPEGPSPMRRLNDIFFRMGGISNAEITPRALFGALCLLMVFVENSSRLKLRLVIKRGAFRALQPILLGRARPHYKAKVEKALENCGFDDEEKNLITAWTEGKISTIAPRPTITQPILSLEYSPPQA